MCDVVAGQWLSVYDGVIVTDPSALEVEPVVALDEAWESGAWQWDDTRRSAFANDLDDRRTLQAVTSEIEAAQGSSDPSTWIPTKAAAVCTYLADWLAVKARWGLTMDQSEAGAIRTQLEERCPVARPSPRGHRDGSLTLRARRGA